MTTSALGRPTVALCRANWGAAKTGPDVSSKSKLKHHVVIIRSNVAVYWNVLIGYRVDGSRHRTQYTISVAFVYV